MRKLVCGVAALVLASCGFSPPTHYYSLVPVQSGPAIAASGPPLQIFHVSIPATLDRESLVEWSESGELKISGSERWAAPLDEMIQNVLAADLRHRLPGLVLLPGDPSPPGDTRGILLNVRHFAALDSARVVLSADWSLMSSRPMAAILTRSETVAVPISSNRSSEVVPVMSQAIAVLSGRIADTICSTGQVTARQ